MTDPAKIVHGAAFTLMALFGLLGALFVSGEILSDPGGWVGAGLVASWVVPMAALSLFALLRPISATPVFIAGAAGVALLTIIDSSFGVIPRHAWGPVLAIAVFASGVVLAFLGLHRAKLAGLLLVLIGVAQLAATVLRFARELSKGEGPSLGAMLTTSSGVIVAPILVVGLLFLLAGSLRHETLGSWR